MPFTLSHPAAVLPLRRFDRLPFAALVAGSIAPDTGYFLSPTPYFRADAHTFARSFTFCVPAGLGILLAFTLLRPGLLRVAPGGFRETLDSLCERNPWRPARLPYTALAILIGAWTHLFWDSWTHHNGFFVRTFPALAIPLWGGIPASRILQHASTAFGLTALYLFFTAKARELGRPIRWQLSRRWLLWGAAALAATAFTAATLTAPWNYWLAANEHRLPNLAVVSLLRNFAVLTAMAAAWAGLTRRPGADK